MRILEVHNHYGDRAVGGEAAVMYAEATLLRDHGHDVCLYERCNGEIHKRSTVRKVKAFIQVGWSDEGYSAIADAIRSFKPDIMHVHNYKYLLSPSIFSAAKDLGVATVLTLHNYRLACPAGQFLRNGRVCERCLDGFPYRMLWHRCSFANPLANLCQFYLYWTTKRRELLMHWVDAYIALSVFAKEKFLAAGLPEDRLFVKPHFTACGASPVRRDDRAVGAIFVGRLSPEKGVDSLIKAWHRLDIPLRIVGDGPLSAVLRERAGPHVEFAGLLPHEDVLKQISRASFLVFPSIWYETFGLTLLEAMASGRPVLASDLGGRREIVREGETGLLFEAGNPEDLRRKALWLIEHPAECERMGQRAREVCRDMYTPEVNYRQLMGIYEAAISRKR